MDDEVEVETLEPAPGPVLRLAGQIEPQDKTQLEKQSQDALRALQDEIFQTSLEVSRDMMSFGEVSPEAENPDQDPIFREWVKSMGRKAAERRYRVARAGWVSKKDAPVGILESTSMAVGIMKARAVEKGGTRVLNVGTVNMYAEIPALPEKEVE